MQNAGNIFENASPSAGMMNIFETPSPSASPKQMSTVEMARDIPTGQEGDAQKILEASASSDEKDILGNPLNRKDDSKKGPSVIVY